MTFLLKRFIHSLPGWDFVLGFLERHKELSERTASLIKRARAQLSREIVEDFFTLYSQTADGIPPENIFNYDETNLQDNPGKEKAIFRRGVKYAEKVNDNTKTSISVMFCGSAAGDMLPPYIVYQGANMYESWCRGGAPRELCTLLQSTVGLRPSASPIGSRKSSFHMSGAS